MATRQQEMDRLEKLARDNAQAILAQQTTFQEQQVAFQTQQLMLDENTESNQSLNTRVTGAKLQLKELKELIEKNLGGRSENRLSRIGRLDFPKFNGEDVEGWLYKCDHVFMVDKTPINMKVHYACINLDGPALQWHQGFITSQDGDVESMVWDDYSRSILNRFSNQCLRNLLKI